MELKKHLVEAWEKKHGRKYDLRQLLYEKKKQDWERMQAIDEPWIQKAISEL